jgi:hypothetical protein
VNAVIVEMLDDLGAMGEVMSLGKMLGPLDRLAFLHLLVIDPMDLVLVRNYVRFH